MKDERKSMQRRRKRTTNPGRAVVISGVLALLVALLDNVVTNLIRVPPGWEWLPVALFVATAAVALWVQLRGAGETEARGGEGAGMNVEVARGAKMKKVEWPGDIGNVIVKGANTSPEEDHADEH